MRKSPSCWRRSGPVSGLMRGRRRRMWRTSRRCSLTGSWRQTMTEDEFVELVETIDANFPPSDTWANAHRVAGEFKPLDAVEVFAALNDWVMNGEPDRARYAPAPAWLIRRARDRMSRNADPTYRAQLPESTGPAEKDLGRWRDENHPGKSWREIIR